MAVTTTYVAQVPVPYDLQRPDAEELLLDQCQANLAEALPGDWTILGDPVFETRGPTFTGATIFGQGEDGEWIGDPRDYWLVVRLDVRSASATAPPGPGV